MIVKVAFELAGVASVLTFSADADKIFDTAATLTFKKNDGSPTVNANILNYEIIRDARPTNSSFVERFSDYFQNHNTRPYS